MNEPLQKGDRVKLHYMSNDPNPIEVGTEGECTGVSHTPVEKCYCMLWDNGRTLSLLEGTDTWEKINK